MSLDLRGACSARALLAALALSPALLPTAALADAAASTAAAEVDQVIVVGRSDKPITVEPRGLSVSLGKTEFEAINAVNVEDLMKYAPDFFVRKRYIGDANAVPGFRGTHSTQSARSLVMVDGFVVSNFLGNSFAFPPKWGVVGPGEVKQFDIVYGPYSARYPGASMGGVVSITTQAPESREAFVITQVFAQPYKQYGTDKTYDGYTFEAGLAGKQAKGPWSGRISYRRLDNMGQPMQWTQLAAAIGTGAPVSGAVVDPNLILKTPVAGAYAPDHTIQDQVRARVGYDFGRGWTAQGLFVLWNTDSDQTNPTTYLRDASGGPVYEGKVVVGGQTYTASGLTLGLSDRREMLAGLKLAGPLAGWDVSANLSHYWIDRQRSRTSSGYTTGISNGAGTFTNQGETGWWTGDLTAERAFGRHAVAVGLNSNLYETDQTTFGAASWKAATGRTFSAETLGKTSLIGVFAEDEISLTPDLSLTAGVRYDRWRAFDGGVGRLVAGAPRLQSYADRDDDAISPKVSLQWEIAPGWRTQLSLAAATRFPTVGELFQGRLDSLGNFDPNSFDPNLKPERSRDANLIVRHSFGPVRITGSLFYQRVEDAIFSLQGFNQFGVVTSSFKNIDVVRQYGVELIGEASDVLVPGLDIDANVAWIDARTVKNGALPDSEGVRFPRIPEWRINGAARYRINEALRLSVGFRYASRPNSDLTGSQRGDTYGYTSEFFIVDTKLAWDINDQVQASVGIDNLNNDKAWVFHPYTQRTVMVELKWKR
ncbi:TonB-dependent receptor [Phenylobacterium sp. LjRoot225]|uniref:TonB-dependent receptor n=1 Tax=Phenylobacterium sp. LjRoot225 TaxID=3342285 RepID=UPI003ECE9150